MALERERERESSILANGVTSMSLLIKRILKNLKKLNDNKDMQVNLYEGGWYRIAKTTGSSRPGAIICKIGTTYNYQAPMSSIIAITTAYQSANLEALCTVLHSSSSTYWKSWTRQSKRTLISW